MKIAAMQDGSVFYYTLPNGNRTHYAADVHVRDWDIDAAKLARKEFVAAMAAYHNAEVEWERT